MPTTPAPRTRPSTCTPGAGSARRAMPIGNIDDTATATPVAVTTPPMAINTILSPNVAMRCRRVKPSAANVGWSMTVCETSRESTIAIATAPARAATPAKTQSASVRTLIASLPPCDSAETSRTADNRDPNTFRAAAPTRGTSAAPWRMRTRRIVEKNAIRPLYARSNAGVSMTTPPEAARSPRSSGRRSMPTIRSRTRGPAGVPGFLPCVASTNWAGVIEVASR